MVKVGSKGFEIRTTLSSDDLVQLEGQLPALGPKGSQALELVRNIAALAQATTEIGIELKLTVDQNSNPSPLPELLNLPISALSGRGFVVNPLRRSGINTIGDLIGKTETELMAICSFGPTGLHTVKSFLRENGLSLRPG
jgi:DNA-directed RNA polymerase alpha subunit